MAEISSYRGRLGVAAAAFYLRHAPIQMGRWRVVRRFLPFLRNHGAAMGRRIVKTRFGFKMQVDLGDWLGQYVYLTGSYEPQTAEVIATILKSGDTFVDVGANAGFFSLLAATRVGCGGRVLAFEPVPAVWQVLESNIRLNAAHQITPHRVALADVDGVLALQEGPASHRGISSLRPIGNAAATHQVDVRRLDNWLPTTATVKLVKIDVEGAEHKVLCGMRGLIERDAPCLVAEVTDRYLREMGSSAGGLLTEFSQLGYHVLRIGEDGLMPIGRSPSEIQFNALFYPAGRLPRALEPMVVA